MYVPTRAAAAGQLCPHDSVCKRHKKREGGETERERYLEKIEKESEEEHSLMTTASVEARDVLSGAQRE